MSKKIETIIADYDATSIQPLVDFLNKRNDIWLIGHTGDGNQLLKMLKNRNIDVLIMDTVLSNMDGIDLIKFIRNDKSIHQPIIIVYSYTSNRLILDSVTRSGADYFMLKYQSNETIYNTIIELYNNKISLITPTRFSDNADVKNIVTRHLQMLSVPSYVNGYKYLKTGFTMILEEEIMYTSITKFYKELSNIFNVGPACIERSIRYAINLAWERSNTRSFAPMLGEYYGTYKPSNKEFIIGVIDVIKTSCGVTA